MAAVPDGIGFTAIAMAVFDVSRFSMEGEVTRHREPGSQRQVRATLTRLFVIVSIAISLEALLFMLDSARNDITLPVDPAFLPIAVVILVAGLGVYQKLNEKREDGQAALPRGPSRSAAMARLEAPRP